jgi:hypothetical protein
LFETTMDPWNTNLSEAELIAAYEQGAATVSAAVAGMNAQQLPARPVPGKWSTLQVVAHLADWEPIGAERMKRTIALDRPLLLAADENALAATLAYDGRDVEEELTLVRAVRSEMSRILRAQPAPAWERKAVHTERGLMTLRQIVELNKWHLEHHVKFIHEKRQKLGIGT